MTLDIPFNEKLISFRIYEREDAREFAAARLRYGHHDACPLCSQSIGYGPHGVVLTISNQVNIPNSVLHLPCFDQDTPQNICQRLADSWAEAQQLKERLLCWFPELRDI